MGQFTIFSANYYNIAVFVGTSTISSYNAQANTANNPFYGASTYSEQGGGNNLITPNEILTADYVLPLGTDAEYLGTISFLSPDDGITREFYVIDDALSTSVLLGSPVENLAYVHFPPSFTPAEIIASSFTPCFLSGTLIDTPHGPRAVETLTPGDPILTAEGATVEVRFNHRRTVVPPFGPAHDQGPVQIEAGALGQGLPRRDLRVTGDHALLIDGLLINAWALVNDETITPVPPTAFGASYTVYHIETEGHEIILAEGAAAETYIDYVARRAFDNHRDYLALHGADRPITELALPRISSARQVPAAVKSRLGRSNAA